MSITILQPIEPLVTIHTVSLEAIGTEMVDAGNYNLDVAASTTYSVANAAIFYPFTVTKQITIQNLWWYNGATVGYNVDVGVYDVSGNQVVHTGNVLSANVNVLQVTAKTATFGPGQFYMALSCANVLNTFFGWGGMGQYVLAFLGCAYMAAANPLPTSATLATVGGSGFGSLYLFGFSTRSVM